MNKLTPEQMAKKAVFMRARNEASIVRAYFVNEVLPVIELEFDRRLNTGSDLSLTMPGAVEFAQAYVDQFIAANRLR